MCYTSLPSRERGLKLKLEAQQDVVIESLPSRERGLKPWVHRVLWALRGSLPSRERGLKQHSPGYYASLSDVAPLAGAWIETR